MLLLISLACRAPLLGWCPSNHNVRWLGSVWRDTLGRPSTGTSHGEIAYTTKPESVFLRRETASVARVPHVALSRRPHPLLNIVVLLVLPAALLACVVYAAHLSAARAAG